MLTRNKRKLFLSTIILGLTAIITQIILLREFLTVFYGNELVIGIILANWMLLTGAGSFIGRYSKGKKHGTEFIATFQFIIGFLPLITVFALFYFRSQLFPVGVMLSITDVLYLSFLLLLPFCLLSGFLFTYLSRIISHLFRHNMIDRVYGLEALGSILGGALFNFILLFYFSTFQSLLTLFVVNAAIAFYLLIGTKNIWKYAILVSTAGLFFLVQIYDPDMLSHKMLYGDQEILYQDDTPYGHIVITETGDQVNFYENGVTLFSSNDVIKNEESVHYAMIQHADPKRVLLVSGGVSGLIDEILKYDVDSIDYVEINPSVVQLGQQYLKRIESDKVNIYELDARLFVKQSTNLYDVVLINLPSPTTAQINRFYTIEFFKELKLKLNPGAVVMTGLMSSGNYISNEFVLINSVLLNTMKEAFANVIIIPGGRNYYLASDNDLTVNIIQRISEKDIANVYVNSFYLDDDLMSMRRDQIMKALNPAAGINTDFKPVSYYQHLLLWLSYFRIQFRIPIIIVSLLIIILLISMNPVNFAMFAGGFSASSIEFLLLIAFQIIYGYVYQMTGVIIMIFMGGLAFGSIVLSKGLRKRAKSNYLLITVLIGLFAFLLPAILILLKDYISDRILIHFILFTATFLIALMVGVQFSLASRIQQGRVGSIAGKLYSADLFGSAIGVLVVTVLLLPLLGVVTVCFIIGALSLLAGVRLVIQR